MGEERLAIAKKMGADAVFLDPQDAASYYGAGGADLVLEASGNPLVFADGIPYMREGGRLCAYAVASKPYVYNDAKTPKHTSSRIDPGYLGELIPGVMQLLREDRFPVSAILTHQWEFAQMPAAFDAVRRGDVVKGLVRICDTI